MIGLSEVFSRALVGCAVVWLATGLVVVVWNGWDRWRNRRWDPCSRSGWTRHGTGSPVTSLWPLMCSRSTIGYDGALASDQAEDYYRLAAEALVHVDARRGA